MKSSEDYIKEYNEYLDKQSEALKKELKKDIDPFFNPIIYGSLFILIICIIAIIVSSV